MALGRVRPSFVLSALAALQGCAAPSEPPSAPEGARSTHAAPHATAAGPTDAGPPTLSSSAPSDAATASDAPSRPRPSGPYGHFFAGLRDLEAKRSTRHVRVAWLGDSHGMADHWSGALRSGLQKRFGDAGPGFVHAGIPHARHDAMKIALDGQFVMKPRGPSTSAVTGDGTFGLGGILAEASGGSRVTLTPTIAPPDTDLTFDVCYKLASPSDQVGIEVGHSPKVIAAVTPTEPEKSLAHMTLSGTAGASITLSPTAGAFLCGVVIETDPTKRPGVVLDTLGINGARYATVLAWNEAAWSAEWKRRAPDLVVLEYGTNELSDIDAKPAVHTRALANVVARIRRTTPDVDCLVLAPTDRLDREAIEPALVTALEDEAQKLGCGFWNTFEKMGGLQSIAKWRSESPPRANRDGIHLNTRGYREMGEKLYADLIAGYTP